MRRRKYNKSIQLLQEKREVEENVEREMKKKNEAKEKDEKALREKDETEKMAQWIQTVVQNLYKEILEVPIVVEATMEEHVSRIGEVIKGFHTRIEDLQSHTALGTPLEERERRERIAMTMVANIKNLDEESVKLCEEILQIWTNLMEDP